MKKNFIYSCLGVILLLLGSYTAHATSYYVSTSGNDSNSGTSTGNAFATLTKAISVVSAGDYIYIEGGTYSYSSTIVIDRSKNGTSSNPIRVFAHNSQTVVLDFSGQSTSSSNRGIVMDAFYWHWKGITIEGAGDNGMLLSGNYNHIEDCIFKENRDTGLQLSRYDTDYDSISEWPSNNTIEDCEAYDNKDPDNEDADGFAAKLTCGTGNKFIRCVAHHNIDDGWDLYTKSDTGAIGIVYFEECISHNNGSLTNGSTSGNGDKNGYKLGSSAHNINHQLVRCIAFNNGKHGFADNGNVGNIKFVNCTSYNNTQYNYHTRDNASHTFVNCLSYDSNSNDRIRGDSSTYPNAFDNQDSWPYTASSSDFQTLSPGSNSNPTSNGFLNLSSGSSLIDVGSNYSLLPSYNGSSPDLGAIESGGSSGGGGTPVITLSASSGDGSVSLSWNITGGTVNNQEIYRDTDSDPNGRTKINIPANSARSYTDNSVSNGTTYYYWIKVNGSENSNAASATPSGSGGSPSIVLSASAGDGSVSLSWSISGISVSSQEVYRDTDSDPNGRTRIYIPSSSDRSYTDNSASNGTTYYYWIKVNGSDNSNAASATPSSGSSGGGSATRIEDNDSGTISYDGSLKSYSNADNGNAINLSNSSGKQIEWNYNASSSGSYTITVRYTRKASMNSSVDMIINGGSSQTLSLPETGSGSFSTASFTTSLNSGNNTIILETNASGESADIDWIEITGNSSRMMSEITKTSTLSIYPNPATSIFYINTKVVAPNATINIYNLQGATILTKKMNKDNVQKIDIEHLKSGSYIVQVKNGDNSFNKMLYIK
ncbi:hypothetical protein NBRC110019_07120 [Neptunitalea chrysea]|uniref:Por secretion system C-terminal sorting domain-containing protein n=1 Tax=Neptunitalea chrysea TaxID=1647581 RepID=A0A9W6B6L6_9FLAO|nr:T9SS type A sorting domain-containing protein [Neptunitalea chrysea]GLB51673.1 hypothetical protein NBRC110019_07120 [Neptunitalea chrysea]